MNVGDILYTQEGDEVELMEITKTGFLVFPRWAVYEIDEDCYEAYTDYNRKLFFDKLFKTSPVRAVSKDKEKLTNETIALKEEKCKLEKEIKFLKQTIVKHNSAIKEAQFELDKTNKLTKDLVSVETLKKIAEADKVWIVRDSKHGAPDIVDHTKEQFWTIVSLKYSREHGFIYECLVMEGDQGAYNTRLDYTSYVFFSKEKAIDYLHKIVFQDLSTHSMSHYSLGGYIELHRKYPFPQKTLELLEQKNREADVKELNEIEKKITDLNLKYKKKKKSLKSRGA